MVMKDKLVKNHRKGRRLQPKKVAALFGALILVGTAVAIPTYISSNKKAERQGFAQEELSSEVVDESTSEILTEEELTSYSEE